MRRRTLPRLAVIGIMTLAAAPLSSCSKGKGTTTGLPPGSGPRGWTIQAPLPGVTTFYGVATPDANTVVAVGKNGLIARKAGIGEWQIQNSGTTENLHRVSFANASLGVAVGENGTALRTTNGGQSWQRPSLPTSESFNGVQFVNSTTATIVGDSGLILRSTNGGASWTDLSIARKHMLGGVHFTDPNTGWVGGSVEGVVGDTATLFVTSNGGASWERRCCTHLGNVANIAFHGSTGIAVGGGTRLRTTDGGATWMNLGLTDVSPFDADLADANKITVVGFPGDSHQSYSFSPDGGLNWVQPTHPGPRHSTTSVAFANASTGWSTGDVGTVLRTTDGGASWEWGSSIPRELLTGVCFTDASHGWAVGQAGIFYTTNAGATWVRQRPPTGGGAALNAVWFTSSTRGFAVGSGSEPMVRTTDGGVTWTPMSPTIGGISAIFFLDANRGWFVGTDDIHATIDGGDTWTPLSDGIATFTDYRAVHFVNASTGWIAGYEGRLARTTDGGANWTTLMGPNSSRRWTGLHFANANEGWMAGSDAGNGVILHTTDGGANWTTQHSQPGESYTAIRFVGSDGWAVGDLHGVAMILHTSNGGATWTDQALGQYPFGLTAISLVDGQIGTAVGNFGLILRTENGGVPD